MDRIKLKKVNNDFLGECLLSQLPEQSFFKVVKSDGTLSRKVYHKGEFYMWNERKHFKQKKNGEYIYPSSYDKSEKKYYVAYPDDCNGRYMSGKTKVSTNFEY